MIASDSFSLSLANIWEPFFAYIFHLTGLFEKTFLPSTIEVEKEFRSSTIFPDTAQSILTPSNSKKDFRISIESYR